LDEGVDLLILDSFPTIERLQTVYEAVASLNPPAPILPSITYDALAVDKVMLPASFVDLVKSWGVKIVGVNGGGPKDLLEILPLLRETAQDDLFLSMMPDAGVGERIDGRTIFFASPEYLAEYTRRFVQKGASIVGGDAGITPRMVREMSSFLRSVQPRTVVEVLAAPQEEEYGDEAMKPIRVEGRSPFGRSLKKDFVISVELDPPRGIDATKSVQGAKFLYEHGIDAINIADGPRASGRMSPIALSILVRRVVPIETIIHVCCRDRNLLALQMDLISANALGLRNLMIITGDPPKMGIYPDATAVFDLDAIGLVQNVSLLNRGLDFAKRPLKGQTAFVIGVGCNPGAADLDLEAKRYEQKVNAGAEFVFSQPIYDPEILERFLKKISHVKPIPFFVGVLPLSSLKNAEFFNENVPGMQVPPEIMKRMAMGSTKEEQRQEGIKIAAEALREAKHYPLVQGAYVFPPFGHYERILDVLEMSEIW
ncbi:MAG: methylenetetrahydrofolate reductase, partial [Candidatus Hinthialibacter sp.]